MVVITQPGRDGQVAATVLADHGVIERRLPSLDTLVVSGLSADQLSGLPGVQSVSPDATLTGRSAGWDDGPSGQSNLATVSLRTAEDAMHARALWPRSTGSGIDVALIDTGIAPVQGLTSPGKVINGPDLSLESQSDDRRYVDNNGHGTHMAGIIAANDLAGSATNPVFARSGEVEGVAPSARLVNVKVGDGHGVADVSQVLAGIDWVVQHAHDADTGNGPLNIRVLNISYGTDSAQPAAIDPLAHAAEVAWRNGIVVVAAAGNDGDTQGRLADPALDPYVIAVGAADLGTSRLSYDDTVPAFSSRGDGVRDPDIVAPGVHVASLREPGGTVDVAYGSTAGVGPRLIRGSGTSQATAMVSGAAALLLAARPDLTPDQVKALLTQTARPVNGSDQRAEGGGLVDLARAAYTQPPGAVQDFPASQGGGSLDAARGTHRVMLDGVALTAEQDIFGHPFDSQAIAAAEDNGAAWSDGSWNGSTWAGSSWAGSSWAGSSWAGSAWAGSSWAGSSWAGSSWAGSSWAGSSWAGYGWGDPAAPEVAASWGGAGQGAASWR
jgi:serine protease AprX